MVEAGGAALEEAGDDHDLFFAGDGREKQFRRRARNRLGNVEERVLLTLAEVLGAEDFGQADDVGAGAGGVADEARRLWLEVILACREANRTSG